jgi:hypothetical protein
VLRKGYQPAAFMQHVKDQEQEVFLNHSNLTVMKKFRIILMSLAVVVAVGGAFASKSAAKTAYVRNTSTMTCNSISVDDNCTVNGTSVCVVSTEVRENATWSCGAQLFKP